MKKYNFGMKNIEILHKNIAFRIRFAPEHIPQLGEPIWSPPGAIPKLEA